MTSLYSVMAEKRREKNLLTLKSVEYQCAVNSLTVSLRTNIGGARHLAADEDEKQQAG